MEVLVLICCLAAVFAGPVQDPTSLKVQVISWNVHKDLPPENLSDVLSLGQGQDLLVLGLQEVFPSAEAKLHRTVSNKWKLSVDPVFKKNGYKMALWSATSRRVMAVYMNPQLAISDVVSSGLFNRGQEFDFKGGDSLVFTVYGRRIMFLNTHFPRGEDNLKLRLEDFHTIEKKAREMHPDVEYTFWFGDLNFCLKDQNDLTADKIADKISKGQLNELLEKDELRSAMKEGKVFKHYKESEISFPPTYKFEVGTSIYDLSRRPAWTDRVLYRAAPGRDITTVYYGSISHLNISDHKPVEAFFRIPLGPKQNNSSTISLS